MLAHSADVNARACERAIDRTIEAYAALRRNHAGRIAIAKLRKFRNKVLAHTLLGVALEATPTYRELFLLMDVAREVTEQARLAIAGIHVDLLETEDALQEVSGAFWRPAIAAAAKDKR
jgi:hypothetical protein